DNAMGEAGRPIKAGNCLWGIIGLARRWLWSGMLVRRWMLRWRRLHSLSRGSGRIDGCAHRISPGCRILVALPPVRDLLLCVKHLFVAAIMAISPIGGPRMGSRGQPAGF